MLNDGLLKWQATRRADAEGVADLLLAPRPVAEIEAERAAAARAATAARKAAKLQRTPPWADFSAIKALHEEAQRLTRETGTAHHVDHELPLQGRLVSGLHVHTNMRVITAAENIRKKNRFEVVP
jgi:hypothetical protein